MPRAAPACPQHVDHRLRRLGIRVVAVVPDRHCRDASLFSPRILPDAKLADRLAQALRRDLEDLRHRDARQQIHDRVASRSARFVVDAERAKSRAVSPNSPPPRAHPPLRESERDRAPGDAIAKARDRSSSAFNTATPSRGRPSISSRFAAATPSIESKNSTCA
jgi:hypothetical protein